MAILHSPESAYAKELTKWEALPTAAGQGLRPYVKRDYPWMMYRAGRLEDGSMGIVETPIVHSESEFFTHFERHFYPTPNDALDGLKAEELELAKLAANRAFEEQHMSEAARAEATSAESETSGHLASVPEKPKRPRGRPPKKAIIS